jgi:hypothetical protein
MSEKDNSVPPLSLEIERARIKCSLGIKCSLVRPRLQDGTRRHRVEAARLALPLRAIARLAEVQEPSSSGGEARRGKGLGSVGGAP